VVKRATWREASLAALAICVICSFKVTAAAYGKNGLSPTLTLGPLFPFLVRFSHGQSYAQGLRPSSRDRAYCLSLLHMKNHIKKCRVVVSGAASALALSLLTVGCAHEISRTETTTVSPNGTVRSNERVVTETPDGTVTRTEKKTINP